jgi:hypothetical protein
MKIKNKYYYNKYIIFIFVVIVSISVFFGIYIKNIQKEESDVLSIDSKKESELPLNTIELRASQQYFASWIKPISADRINLHLNTGFKKNMRDFYIDNECKYLTSGGFYTSDDRPLGLFFTNDVLVRNYVGHNLMRGIFSADYNNIINISTEINFDSIRFALQTGPILILNGEKYKYSIKNDRYARRIAVAITSDNLALFIAFYGKENSFSGPLLSELPDLLDQFSKLQNVNIFSAVNLDGGTASAFVGDELILEEIKYIGSFFCIK